MSETKPKLSAIIACYRDAQAVPVMYSRLRAVFAKLGVDYEIIFVNDGSPDNSREVLAALAAADNRLLVINHARNFGSQNAFTSGMRIASGDAVILMDGDLQDPPEVIEGFYHKWREGYDVVYGVRETREASLLMQSAYKMFYRVFHFLSYLPVPLDAGDFSLISRRVTDVLNGLPESNRFMRGLRAWAGFKQVGVPYMRPERMFGSTTNSFLRNLDWARKAIFSFSYAPLDFIIWLAFLAVAGSFVAILGQVAVRLLYPDLAPHGFPTVIILTLFMGGIQMLCLGIIGSYLSHIYDEVKRRPPYVVESYLNYVPGKDAER
ncbi:MAG: hypothetical protein A2234_02485 [Elusimicrobia bacterium RIFOXYA2_FULL_58_8]|nr:MAG: hypothetical protein A2285_04235 [Elusimicrobia bacterium RIFOXYA12_FULL_57_11]OGS13177.1 MAG: hypothetical protein A2234_02485 [Elusimicrobia bacterium RIFOXYA2_FULL_58_8]